jgi:hypothetical protein
MALNFWILAMILVLPGNLARAQGHFLPSPACAESDHAREEHGGGGEQPDPLTVYNQRVELAGGELYLLSGHVRMAPAFYGASQRLQPYLEIDFAMHPWLGSKARKRAPMYPIEGSASAWQRWDGAHVELAVKARAQVMFLETDAPAQVITLKVIPEASVFP